MVNNFCLQDFLADLRKISIAYAQKKFIKRYKNNNSFGLEEIQQI